MNAPRLANSAPRAKNCASQPYDSPWNRSSQVIGARSDARTNSKSLSPGRGFRPGGGGAFQSIAKGRESNITCACHWTVNVAASRGHTKLFADAYSVAPSGIFVNANSQIASPADLAGVPISVGFQSGSHYATIQALETYLEKGQMKLSFDEGMLFIRMEAFF